MNQGADKTNTLTPQLYLRNVSNKNITLSDITLSYFFSTDGNTQNVYECDYARMNYTSITGQAIGTISVDASGNADLTVAFRDSATVLKPGDEIEIQGRIHSQDWKLYNRINDYSLGTADYSDTGKIVVKVKGEKIHGTGP